MLDSVSNFLNKSLKNFTFRQRLIIFASIFLFCIPLPFYWLIVGQNLYIESARVQIENFDNQRVWNTLLNDVLLYHLNYLMGNEDNLAYYNKKIYFNLSSIENRQSPSEKSELKSRQADFMSNLWQRIISKKAPSSYVHFAKEERILEIILDELKLRTLGDKRIHINLLPDNQIINFILCELYNIQIFSVNLLTWESFLRQEEKNKKRYEELFDMSLSRLNEAIKEVNDYFIYSIRFNSLIEDDSGLHSINKRNVIKEYLKNLNLWIAEIKQKSIQDSIIKATDLLTHYNYIEDSLIDFGIHYNTESKNWHKLIRSICIIPLCITFVTILFYVIFHVLTSHFLELNEYIKAISHGKFKQCFCSKAGDDFGPVGKAFDKLAASMHKLVNELQRLGRQLADSIKQISQSSSEQNESFVNDEKKIKELEEYTQTIAGRTQVLAKTMNELSLSTQQNTVSEKAKITLEKTRQVISSLSKRSNNIMHYLTTLSNKLEANKNLFLFLTKVSNQASLLSLNSAIVAANITNHKQGLTKISSEIQRFSEKTSASTGEMEQMIQGVFVTIQKIFIDTKKFLNELNQCSEMLQIVEKHLQDMTNHMLDQSAQFQMVNQAMQNQANVTDEIKKSLDHLAQVAKENIQHTHHLGHTMIELNATAEKLQVVLNQFFHPKKLKSKNETYEK